MAYPYYGAYGGAYQQPFAQPQIQPPYQQQMTPPTIRAEIVQVDGEQAAANYPVGPGASQMMIARDDSAIYVKTALPNGGYTLDVFAKRPQKPVDAHPDMSEYVRRDEIAGLVTAILAGSAANKQEATA